ncbi:MAG: tetratricopeptide repeat protein, partial [Candidatus Omnitrophica bacterium]|nr:tetratricopeptide repeat protein [Candidatus Omnitrophota bacterium]
HVVNLLLHIVSAGMVWWFVLLTLASPVIKGTAAAPISKTKPSSKSKKAPAFIQFQGDPIAGHAPLIALLAGLVFVSHPLQTQAVTYIVQRAAALVTLFYVATLCFYAKSRLRQEQNPSGGSWKIYYAAALAADVMAMYSKEIAITLPLMILLYEFCFFNVKGKFPWAYLAPFLLTIFLIPGTMYLTRGIHHINSGDLANAMQGTTRVSSADYLLTQFRVIVTYIRLFFLPIHQNLDYDYRISKSLFESPTLLSFLLLCGVLYAAIRLFAKYRLLSFGIFWFFLSLGPESSIFPINDVIFEHRLYLPMAGLSLFIVAGVYYLVGRRSLRAMTAVLILIVAVNTALSYQRNKVWKDEFTLWGDTIQKSPHKARPYNNLGNAYLKEGKFDLAIKNFNKAIALDPAYAEPLVNLGLIYDHRGRWAKALSYYNKAIAANPHFAGAYDNRGSLYNEMGKIELALNDYNKAIGLDPRFAAAYNNRGYAYSEQLVWDKAISDFNQALALNPHLPQAYSGRGISYDGQGNFSQAILDLNMAIKLAPQNADSYFDRGLVYARHKNMDQAVRDFNKAAQINPNYANAYHNLGIIHFNQGKLAQALRDFDKALALNPRDAQAFNNRGVIHLRQGDLAGALADYDKALQISPDYADAFYNRGHVYILQIKFRRALADFNKAIALNRRNAGAYADRAAIYYQSQEFDKAWADIHEAQRLGAEVNPRLIQALKQASAMKKSP